MLGALPEAVALEAGAALGWLAGVVFRVRRGVVDANLVRAFPHEDASWRRRVAVESYRHLGREAVMTFRLARSGPEDVIARTDVLGLASLVDAASTRGAVVATGHFGNWELGGSAVAARGVPLDVVAFRQRNRLFDEELVRTRGRLGMRVVTRGRAPREVLRSLRDGRITALVADQNAGRRGVFVDFFGHPASTARGPALFALRSGAALFTGFCLAMGGSPRRYVVHLEEVPVERNGDLEEDVLRLTRAHGERLERFIRRAPEQYFWQHNRWKTRPPGDALPAEA
ncbi:MAG TPA: lysophospholipid acyltransferase family protein [Candidatus Thermoplasmatota archaeon]